MSDIEIARKAQIKHIGEIVDKLGIPNEAQCRSVIPGHTKAKISIQYMETLKDRPDLEK